LVADTAYSITAHDGRFCLARGGKPVKTGKGHTLATGSSLLAEGTLNQLQGSRPRVFLLGYWQAVLDAEEGEVAHMRQTLHDGLIHDQLLYPADGPADFIPQQQAAWREALAWLAGQGAHAQPTVWVGQEVVEKMLGDLPLPSLVWVYGASRLLQSTALGLWALHQPQDAKTLLQAGYSDELYQQSRYKADDEVAARLGRIEADLADLCAIRGALPDIQAR
jgi:hypothetical protein